MFWKTASAIMMSLLVLGTLALAFSVQPVTGSGTVHIGADGSSDSLVGSIRRITSGALSVPPQTE